MGCCYFFDICDDEYRVEDTGREIQNLVILNGQFTTM